MPTLFQSLVTCRQNLEAFCEAPDFSPIYPFPTEGGAVMEVERLVCAFARNEISIDVARDGYMKSLVPLLEVNDYAKLKAAIVTRDVMLWLVTNRRYVMGVEFLLAEINEQPEIRDWVVKHAGNLRDEKAQQALFQENLEPLLTWFSAAREMEIAMVMLWADSLVTATILRCPDSGEAKAALSHLGETLHQQGVYPEVEALIESMSVEDMGQAGLPVFILDYESFEDFELIGEPEEDETLKNYRHREASAGRVMTEAGTRVIHVLIKTADYLRWLAANGKKNSQASRVRFACETWMQSEEKKP
jgi:hypothetical protein